MGANETRITRITRAIGTVTSIFRCRGLSFVPPTADRIGGHDLVYWIGFLALLSAWFLFAYMPQCRRYERLTGRQESLALELESDKKELARLHSGIASLHNGDALAWERAARKRLGWLEPGEVLDAEKWRQSRNAIAAVRNNSSANPGGALHAAPAAPILPRPRVPQIPHAQNTSPGAITHVRAPANTSVRFADSGALGSTQAQPPAPPPAPIVPTLPQRQPVMLLQGAHVVSYTRRY